MRRLEDKPTRCRLLSPFRSVSAGEFELVMSPMLLSELTPVLDYPKIVRLIPGDDPSAMVRALHEHAIEIDDPENPPPIRASDPMTTT